MKLRRLKADGFGPLRGEYVFDAERVTLVVDDNERGKSSLLSAIAAALYGLASDKRTHRVVTPLERWRPWEGSGYRLELELEHRDETLTIRRDFERGTVEVWNARGQEVTETFREGRDEYPVGRRLLGLDAEEFEKCALVRQNELEGVVPGDERARRAGTLHARLENAADTRAGDTNAAEAVQVLEGALRRYTCAELDSTLTIDKAISRLELLHGTVDSEIRRLEHELEQVAGPMEALRGLAREEAESKAALERLDGERRASLVAGLEREWSEEQQRRAELEALRAEAGTLQTSAHVPPHAEGELRETVARLTEARSQLDTLEARRTEQQARERAALEQEAAALGAYAALTPADADRCVALAAELKRLEQDEARERAELDTQRESLAARGWDSRRRQELEARFGALDPSQRGRLEGQTEHALAYQTEVAQLEARRTDHTESLRVIDAARAGRRLPGWFLVALGIGAFLAGATVLGLQGLPVAWASLLGLGLVLGGAGWGLLASGLRLRAAEREEVLRALTDAQRRLNELRAARADDEVALAELARALGHRDLASLLREWGEYVRLTGESGPASRVGERLAALDERRRATLSEVESLLARAGGGVPDAAGLERVAAGVRHLASVRERLAALEGSWSWSVDERRNAEATVDGLREKAVRILQSAGLVHDPGRSWSDHVRELSERARSGARLRLLEEELIPQAAKRVRPEAEAAGLRERLEAVRAQAAADWAGAPRSVDAIENDARREHDRLAALQQRRVELQSQVNETCRRHAEEHPAKCLERERLAHAARRARAFKHAVELAIEEIQSVAQATHRRWADFLNRRVGELLEAFGTRVEQLRFGDDLDFSLRTWNGQPMTRGRAVLQLSAGARDQLHLAVRIAISEFLSRGATPLPLLLDDVFATSDDGRARAGLRLLLEHLSKQHQIIVVTCHRARHERLAALDPELWAQGVRWVDVQARDRAVAPD